MKKKAKTKSVKTSTEEFEQAISGKNKKEKYHLKLYITGMTELSMRAVENIKRICEEHLKGRYVLDIIDIHKNPVLPKGEQIIAAPTLIKKIPLPLRRFIGDLSNTDKVLLGLDLKKEE